MTSAVNNETVSPEAEVLIADGLRAGRTPRQIQTLIRKKLEEKVTLKTISQKRENHQSRIDTKKLFKKKGADIVRKFLEKAKEGGDISDQQAVLEQAVYFDCLRRYAADEDNFLQDVNTKDLLKITHDYQKAKLRQLAGASNGAKFAFSPVHAIELLGIVEESFSDSPELKEAFASRRDNLMKKIKPLFNAEDFEAASDDYEAMQRIRAKYELSKQKIGGKERGGASAAA